MSKKSYTQKEWFAEGQRLFGADVLQWRFKCPRCGNIASIQEFKDAGAKHADDAAKNCIGRFVNDRGCDWAAYGLFDICSVHVDGIPVFEFAPPETISPPPDNAAGQTAGPPTNTGAASVVRAGLSSKEGARP